MATSEAMTIYKRRSRCELVHAKLRNLNLDRLLVRTPQGRNLDGRLRTDNEHPHRGQTARRANRLNVSPDREATAACLRPLPAKQPHHRPETPEAS
jgi:hypothetical protein